MKKILIFLFMIIFSFCLFAEDDDISFKFGVMIFLNKKSSYLELEKNNVIDKKSAFQFIVDSGKANYFYIFLKDEFEELSVIFPENGNINNKTEKIILPKKSDELYTFDGDAKKYQIIILAGKTPFKDLDETLKEYYKYKNSNDKEKKSSLNVKIMDEIIKTKKLFSEAVIDPEKQSAIAGHKKRGMTQINAKIFYSKTINIELK